ncbi:MAG TPA: hypothetical protein VGN57_15205 [Pirellulaceae bacterium]|jgi:hypothetical protein|nr:hypothetical protein [Pirellulaceae bacterium]
MPVSPFRSPLASLLFALLATTFAASGPQSGRADEPAASPADASEAEFVRLTRTEKGRPAAMETAIVRYVRGEGDQKTVVDLIGAVHIGEASYYKSLNEAFEKYETLLYELVAHPDDNKPQQREDRGPALSVIGGGQQAMQNLLGLEFQLQGIDYGKENFVHADMSPEEFAQSMKERDESWTKMYFRSIGFSAVQPGQNESGMALLGALFSENRELQLKRAFASQIGDMRMAVGALSGKEGSTILTERNRVALEKLDEILKEGKRTVGVFYGAAHLPDMEKRLLERGFTRGETTWLEAWNLRDPSDDAKSKAAQK